jgi:N-acetylglucosamine-6-phosphate deacetylase
VFETKGLGVSLIPDGIHVSAPLFRLIHRELDPACIFYVTDAMAAAGSPPGSYTLGALQIEVGPDEIVRQPGSPLFAGSALTPLEGIRRASTMLRVPWQEVWGRMSEHPARLLGIRDCLAVGDRADLCVISAREGRIELGELFAAGRPTLASTSLSATSGAV